MKSTTARIGARMFLRALATVLTIAIALMVFVVKPAFAVQVWNIGDNFEQPPGTPKGKANLIFSGVYPGRESLPGNRCINLKVVASRSGKPIVNATAYLVRKLNVPETVVYNTDNQGCALIWNIEDCYRKLVVTGGVVTVRQWISLPPGCPKDMVVKLPYECRITVPAPPVKCSQFSFYAFRQEDDSAPRTYNGERLGNMLTVWVPPGRYEMVLDACDKQGDMLKRYFWNQIAVPSGTRLFIKAAPRIEIRKPPKRLHRSLEK